MKNLFSPKSLQCLASNEVQLRLQHCRPCLLLFIHSNFPRTLLALTHVASKEAALQPRPTFPSSCIHGARRGQVYGWAALIHHVFILGEELNERGLFHYTVRSGEMDVSCFCCKVGFNIMCVTTSVIPPPMRNAVERVIQLNCTHSEPNSQSFPVAIFQHSSSSSRTF